MKIPHRLLSLVVVAGLALGVAACSDDGDLPDDSAVSGSDGGSSSAVLQGLADDVIVPAYEQLVVDLTTLTSSVEALCATPSADTLAAAQEAWRTTALSWQGTRGGAVGPSMDRRLMADVAFRARPDPVEDLIAGDEPIDTEALGDKGSTFRGISLVEHLLFAPESSAALITPEGARRCSFIANVLPISTDGAFFLFPLAYVLGDVISEVYGFRAMRRTILAGFAVLILASLCFWLTIHLPAADFYEGQESFETVA